MPVIDLTFADPAWPDLMDRDLDLIHYREPIKATALPGGMASGATSIALRFDLPSGHVLIVETSLAALNALLVGIKARYPDPPGTGMNAA